MSLWNLADLIAIARENPTCVDEPPMPAVLRGAQFYAARDAKTSDMLSAAEVAQDPAVADRLRRWASVPS